ncbi:unnamed protein product [Didymodactylos carnosus]|uniref:G-protein coupled receptors family 1 profile domain-containing protein n=1 Tax=Didymodactylos carnosus TaxID=1234261 RepID=A0A815ESD5_9BILA|nr:unnamed protein product [Didymodactylos carnosus]CAF1316269.1 unnamed protein product [Didymodactylos carnosus]CAF3595858.1 unnamed protein product [Didymodactylos carnosus]CAF4158313.1 unnamed protein product [Didymodactylos carnosus]
MKSKLICTKKNVVKATIAFAVFFCLFSSFWFCPLNEFNSIDQCVYNTNAIYYFFLLQIHAPLRLILVCVIPVITMAAANIRLLKNIRQSRRRVAAEMEGTHTTYEQQQQQQIQQLETTISQPARSGIRIENILKLRRLNAIDRMLILMMITNVTMYVVTQVPYHIYAVSRGYYQGLDSYTNSLVRALLLIWSSLYFGLGFYLFCLASPLFRQKFAKTAHALKLYFWR